MNNSTISFDPMDVKGMENLMEQYGNSEVPFSGKNENGEDVTISVFYDKIIVSTDQANGWVRKNIYHKDGTREESFDGKWR